MDMLVRSLMHMKVYMGDSALVAEMLKVSIYWNLQMPLV